MVRALRWIAVLALLAAAAGWFLSRPTPLESAVAEALADGDPERGEPIFVAAGCASCHVAPEGERDSDQPVLAGGQRFPSPFGTFVAPNISTDADHGIGRWSEADIARAITEGVSPDGRHYYPAFPYAAYAKARPRDVADLVAFLRTLPADATPSQPHDVGFPFNIRRGVGLWKVLFSDDGWVIEGDLSPEEERGRYLAEALAHCGECHTPRNMLGALDTDRWMAGAPAPDGDGRIPNVTPAGLDWSEADIAAYLESGFTPEFDTAGGLMVAVVENFARLDDDDRAAVAAYLKRLPPVE